VPRLSSIQAQTLAQWWNLAQDFAREGFTTTELISAANDIARQAGEKLSFATNTALSTIYGYARRMFNAASVVQSALDSDVIGKEHLGIPPWARDEQVMNTSPIWHVTYQFTYLDSQGDVQYDYKTSIFKMTFPDTIGELKDMLSEDAQALADKYGVEFVSADLHEILSV
jgi:hypothetical protein